MTADHRCDVAVVGGGIIGLAIAWRAAAAGLAVTLLDPAPRQGASWVAAGMLAPVTELHYGEEELLALNLASAERWPSFAAELEAASDLPAGFDAGGTLAVAFDRDDREALAALIAYQDSLGLDVERLTSRQARQREPMVAPGIAAAASAPHDHRVDPRSATAALWAATERAGVKHVAERVVRIDTAASHGQRVTDTTAAVDAAHSDAADADDGHGAGDGHRGTDTTSVADATHHHAADTCHGNHVMDTTLDADVTRRHAAEADDGDTGTDAASDADATHHHAADARHGNHVTGVTTASGLRVEAARVVVAAAWESPALLGAVPGAPVVPVRPVKGQLLVLRNRSDRSGQATTQSDTAAIPHTASVGDGTSTIGSSRQTPRSSVGADRTGSGQTDAGAEPLLHGAVRALVEGSHVYLVPRRDGRLIVGATVEEQGCDTCVTAGGVYELLRDASLVVPGISELQLVEAIAGLRPATPDNAPVLGPSEQGPAGLVFATGHYRNGILLSAITADVIAAVLVDGAVPALARPFSPDRFVERPGSKELPSPPSSDVRGRQPPITPDLARKDPRVGIRAPVAANDPGSAP